MFSPERFLSTGRKATALAFLLGGSLLVMAALPASAQDHDGGNAAPRAEPHDRRGGDHPAPRSAPPRQGSNSPTGGYHGGTNPGGNVPGAHSPTGSYRGGTNPGGTVPGGNYPGGVHYGTANGAYPRNSGGQPFISGPPRGAAGPDARFAAPPRGGYGYNRPPPPERIVPSLPPGYRSYYWGNTPYYQHQGHWYRPYGGSYVIVGAPYGLFMPYLPAYYSTFWFGGTRYYMADDTYYLYDPQRQGYVVTQSPYGGNEDEIDDSGRRDSDLFVYPMRGQSEKQQADDRYDCHRWAVNEAHYDPTDAEYRSADRQAYDRALTACLTGRGYSVK